MFDVNSSFIVQGYTASTLQNIFCTSKFFVDSPLLGKYLLINNNHGESSNSMVKLEVYTLTIYGNLTGKNR